MKDNEIIAILEGCDDAQRARVMAWARKRWPAPKKGAKAAPAQAPLPAAQPIDPEAFRKFVEEMRRTQPATPPYPTPWPTYIPPPYQPSPFTQPMSPPDWGPMWVTKVTCGSLTVDPGASWPLGQATPTWTIRNGSPS